MRSCFLVLGLICLAVAAGSMWILFQIGGKSDGPGALLFYIGAFGGLLFGIPFLQGALSGSSEAEAEQPTWP